MMLLLFPIALSAVSTTYHKSAPGFYSSRSTVEVQLIGLAVWL
jgi:hypothetical protein